MSGPDVPLKDEL